MTATSYAQPFPAYTGGRFVEYLDVIADAIANQPRTLQRSIGPSEIGSPCARRIGYKLLHHKEKECPPNWKAFIGTGTHLNLEGVFDRYNLDHYAELDGQERFYIETKVSVGEVNGVEVTGSCDLYDRMTGTVVDHKVVGDWMLGNYRKKGPGDQYRIQAHLYGRGWQRAGLPVDTVAIAFLPRNGQLADTYLWSEPYDETIAIGALMRLEGISLTVGALGYAALEHLPTFDAWCQHCPFFAHKSDNLERGCPGDPSSNINKPTPTTSSEYLGI